MSVGMNHPTMAWGHDQPGTEAVVQMESHLLSAPIKLGLLPAIRS